MSDTKTSDSDLKKFLAGIDSSKFSIDGHQTRVNKPWGYELLLVPEGWFYMSKIMHINAGCRQSMQIHDGKTETYTILRGRGALLIENKDGELVQVELQPGTGYTTRLGQRHRLIGITDCDIFESSTPESGTTWRLADDYARGNETEQIRAEPHRGWN